MKTTKRLLLFIVVVIGCVGLWRVYRHIFPISAETQVRQLLAHAGKSDFAPIPPSATNFAYYQWNGLFTGETYARFQLSLNDLKSFMTNSRELAATKPKDVFAPTHPRLPLSERTQDAKGDPIYYSAHAGSPEWFKPTIRGNGKGYFLWPDKYIYIDEDEGIVWINFIKG